MLNHHNTTSYIMVHCIFTTLHESARVTEVPSKCWNTQLEAVHFILIIVSFWWEDGYHIKQLLTEVKRR